MINLHQLFRAFSRVSTSPDSSYSPVSSATRDPVPFLADAAAAAPAAHPPVSTGSLAADVAASVAPAAADALPAAAAPVSAGCSLPVAVVLGEVSAPAGNSSSAAATTKRETNATIKKRSDTWQQDDLCGANLPFIPADAAPPPGVASLLPVSPSCSTASAETAAAGGAAAAADTAAPEYIEAGSIFSGCNDSDSPTDHSKVEETGVQEMQQQQEFCYAANTVTETPATAVVRCFPGGTHNSAATSASVFSLSSRGSPHPPLLAAESQPTSAALVSSAFGALTSQGSAASQSAVPGLMSRIDSGSTTSSSGGAPKDNSSKNDSSRDVSSLGRGENSGSRTTSCSTSRCSSSSPEVSSSKSPTTSCLGDALGCTRSAGREAHSSFSLSLSAAAGAVAAVSDKEVIPSPLSQQDQGTAIPAAECVAVDQQQGQPETAIEEAASRIFESTTSTLLNLQPRQETLHASAALAAALAAAKAAEVPQGGVSEKTRQQQPQGVRCLCGEDSSGDSTAETSPACADFTSLLKKHDSGNSDEEEFLIRSLERRLSSADVTPAPAAAAGGRAAVGTAATAAPRLASNSPGGTSTSTTATGAIAAAAAPPAASDSPEETSLSTTGFTAAARMAAAASAGAGVGVCAAGQISAANGGGATAAETVAAAASGGTLFAGQQQPPSPALVKTTAAEATAEIVPLVAAVGAGDCAVNTRRDSESPKATDLMSSSNFNSSSCRMDSCSDVISCNSNDEEIKATPLQQQQDAGAAEAGKKEVGLPGNRAKAAAIEPADAPAENAETGTFTPSTTVATTGEGDALSAGDNNAAKEEGFVAVHDAEQGTGTAEGSLIDNRGSTRGCGPGEEGRTAAATAAGIGASIPSGVAFAVTALSAGDCAGSAAAVEASTMDSSSCLGFLEGETAEKGERSSNSSSTITTISDRSKSNTSTSSDDCSGAERCFSASVSAADGSLQSLSAATTRAGPGEEGQLQQQQEELVAAESARLFSSAFPPAASAACSTAEKLKLLPPATNGSGTSRGLALWGLDETTAGAFSFAAADASAAAAVATWFSSLLPQQQQQLCAAASAALLPGLLLQPNMACSSPSSPSSNASARGPTATHASSEKPSDTAVALAAKENATSSTPAAHTTEPPCTLHPDESKSAASVPTMGKEVPGEACGVAGVDVSTAEEEETQEKAASRKSDEARQLLREGETQLTPLTLHKGQLSTAENQEQQQVTSSTKEQQQQVPSPVDQQISSAPRQHLESPLPPTVTAPPAAVVPGGNGSSSYQLNDDRTLGIPSGTAAAAAGTNVSFASLAASSAATSSASSAASPPPAGVTCLLPGGMLSSSLLLSSAAAAPFTSSLSLVPALPTAASASNRSPVVAAVTRSVDDAARNTLLALPLPGVPAAAGANVLLPASAAAVGVRGTHTNNLAATLPATPVLAAAAGALFPAAGGSPSCITTPSTATTPGLSNLHPLAAFRSAAATPCMRLQQPASAPVVGQERVHQPGKDLLLATASSPYPSPSACGALSLSCYASSSASSFTASASQVGPGSSCLLPPLAAKATPALLQSTNNYGTAAVDSLDKKHFPVTTTSPAHGAAVSSPAAGAPPSSSVVPAPSVTVATRTLDSATGTDAGKTSAGTLEAADEQSGLPAASPFSASTASASAFSSPSPTPLGGPAASLPCDKSSSSSGHSALPVLSEITSAGASTTTAGAAAPQLQLQQPDPLRHNSNTTPAVQSISAGKPAKISASTLQASSGVAATSAAGAVAPPAGTSSLDTAGGAPSFGGTVDGGFWGATAQHLLLQLNMQQLQHHEQQQQGQLSLESMTFFPPGAFLPPLCISPLAAAAVADSSARPFNVASVHKQQVAAAAAARTAAILQEAAARGGAAAALRRAGGATAAAAANANGAAQKNNLSALLAVAAAMKQVNNTHWPSLTSVKNSPDNCEQQGQQQNCDCAGANSREGRYDKATAKPEGDSTRAKPSSQIKLDQEQQVRDQQDGKQLTVNQQHRAMQPTIVKQKNASGESGKIFGHEGPPAKRARRGGAVAPSTTDSSTPSVPSSGSSDCLPAAAPSASAHTPPFWGNADATTLKKAGAAAAADRGPFFATAAGFTGVQQQLLAQLQQNQLLLQSATTSGERYLLDSRLTECNALSDPALVAAPAATGAAASMGSSAAMQQGFRYFVESLSNPSVAQLSATAGAGAGEDGATSLTAPASPGQVVSSLLTSRPHGAPTAATSLATSFPPPTLLPPFDIRDKNSNAKEAAAAVALHFQTLQQLHRLQLNSQQQQHDLMMAACSVGAGGCSTVGVTTAANLGAKSNFATALPLSQQQRLCLTSSTSVLTHAGAAAGGGKLLSNEQLVQAADSSNSDTAKTAAVRDSRTTDTASAAGGSGNSLRGGARQQKRPARQEQQQQRQQQRHATSLQRQEQNAALQSLHQHHPGVCYSPPKDVWRARITVEGRQHEQQFSVKRHGFEEARLLAVQWRSQMERLRLGGADGGGGTVATGGRGCGTDAVACSGAKGKGTAAGGTSKAGGGSNHLRSSSSGSTTRPINSSSSSSSSGTNVSQCLVSSSSRDTATGKAKLSSNIPGQQDITAESSNVPVVAQQTQLQDFASYLTACGGDLVYRNLSNISQLAGLSSGECRPVSSPTNASTAGTAVSPLNVDPLSQMRTLALSARHLMQTRSLCAVQQQSSGSVPGDINSGSCSTVVLFPPPLLSFLDAAVAGVGGRGKAAAAPVVGEPGLATAAVPAADRAPPAPPVPAVAAGSRVASAAAAIGCS